MAFVRTKQTVIILFMTKLNLIIHLFWEIGYRHREGSCRYASIYVCLDYIACHKNRIKGTIYYLRVGISETWELHKLTGSVAGNAIFNSV